MREQGLDAAEVMRRPMHGYELLAGAFLYLLLNFILTPPQLGMARFYFNLYIGLGGAVIGIVKCCRRRAAK
jgi:hypothetical protein